MESYLTGLGLSGSAGLNAYLPLFIIGLMVRFEVMEVKEPYDTLGAWPVLLVLVILLLIEMTADKIPAVDSLNDGINTLIRPTAGALLMASSTSNVESTDATALTLMSILSGSISAGVLHSIKATARPAVTVTTGGMGNFVVSIVEDIISLLVSIFAILLPFLVIFFIMSVVALAGWLYWEMKRTRRYFPRENHFSTDLIR